MPTYQDVDPDIKAMQGIHLYQYFLSNCSQRVCLALEEKGQNWTPHPVNLFTQENTRDECFRTQPWYAPLMCLALRIKSRQRRSGPAPMKPRLAA